MNSFSINKAAVGGEVFITSGLIPKESRKNTWRSAFLVCETESQHDQIGRCQTTRLLGVHCPGGWQHDRVRGISAARFALALRLERGIRLARNHRRGLGARFRFRQTRARAPV